MRVNVVGDGALSLLDAGIEVSVATILAQESLVHTVPGPEDRLPRQLDQPRDASLLASRRHCRGVRGFSGPRAPTFLSVTLC